MNESGTTPEALMSFSIGPVQGFIKQARTVRDLWSGSYLLSWLTGRAIAVCEERGGKLLACALAENPIVRFHRGDSIDTPKDQDDPLLLSCLPNQFLVTFPDAADTQQMPEIAKAIEQAVRDEWLSICNAVHGFLKERWDPIRPGWDDHWSDSEGNDGNKGQVEHFWEIHCIYLPGQSADELRNLAATLRIDAQAHNGDDSRLRRAVLARIGDAHKAVRKFAHHEPDDEHRPKCALSGDHHQMLPRAGKGENIMVIAKKWWEEAAEAAHGKWTRMSPKDRFCAINLVKRMAWAHYLSEKLGAKPQDMRTPDTATIAARHWMCELDGTDELGNLLSDRAEEQLMDGNHGVHWSGHWLHWDDPAGPKGPETGDQEECPEDIWQMIQRARQDARERNLPARPPAYYAILMLDGDRMGGRFARADDDQYRDLSEALAGFASEQLPRIVREHLGHLIYAGGDDVLALLPTATALKCAGSIRQALAGLSLPSGIEPLTCSAGIAVAHYKFDLRDALDAARAAEQHAKKAGRDRLAVTILRRSGEHTTGLCRWDAAAMLDQLVDQFRAGKSDRWAYQLRAVLERLAAPDVLGTPSNGEAEVLGQIIDSELVRLLGRAEPASRPDEERVRGFWDRVLGKSEPPTPPPSASDSADDEETPRSLRIRREAITLIQSAAFLARGREE